MRSEDGQVLLNSYMDTNCIDPWEGNEKEVLVQVYLWLDGVLRCILASIGLIGNVFAIVIFSSKELKSTFNTMLILLAIFDSGYLSLTLLEETLQIYDIQSQGTLYPDPKYVPTQAWLNLYPKFTRPFRFVFFTASEFLTVAIAIDRYIAIKYPFLNYSRVSTKTFYKKFLRDSTTEDSKDERILQMTKIDYQKVSIHSISVFVFSLLYCIPVFLECEKVSPRGNDTATIKCELAESKNYTIIYYVALDSIVRFIIPLFILLYTNCGIYQIIKSQPVTPNNEAAYQRRAQNMMLFGVVILMVIVHLFRFGVNIYQVPINDELKACGKDAKNQIVHLVSNFLITFNSSANCFIYLAASKKFRDVAFRHYLKFPAWCSPICSTKCGRCCVGSIDPKQLERFPETRSRKITPFGCGYVAWGSTESGNFRVLVSQMENKTDQVMEVSVITSPSN